MHKQELQAEMRRKGFTYESMAKALGISVNGFWRKINNMTDFTLPEIQILIKELGLDDTKIKTIFFNR